MGQWEVSKDWTRSKSKREAKNGGGLWMSAGGGRGGWRELLKAWGAAKPACIRT